VKCSYGWSHLNRACLLTLLVYKVGVLRVVPSVLIHVHFRGGDGGEGVMASPSYSGKAGHVDVYRRCSEIKYLPRGLEARVCL